MSITISKSWPFSFKKFITLIFQKHLPKQIQSKLKHFPKNHHKSFDLNRQVLCQNIEDIQFW